MLRGFFITICLVAASPSVAQQVRVITGDIEHVYGPGGEVLDDAKLRARNRRAERQIQGQGAKADLDQQQSIQTRPGSWNVQNWGARTVASNHPRVGGTSKTVVSKRPRVGGALTITARKRQRVRGPANNHRTASGPPPIIANSYQRVSGPIRIVANSHQRARGVLAELVGFVSR